MKLTSTLALAALVATTTLARADSTTAVGFWETKYPDGSPQGWFLVSEKNDVYSARLVKGFKEAGNDKPPQMICTDCPGKKKGAHVMGLTLFYNLKRDGLAYKGGSVLDPRDGSVYHAKMDLSEDGQTLAVRGYLGIEMLGKTSTWTRLADDAMKKDEIPKEILADANEGSSDKAKADASTDKAKKGKSVTVASSKPHKAKQKAEEADAAPVSSADASQPAQ